jgi:asparagine synthase (glutamine-hydrolysing)
MCGIAGFLDPAGGRPPDALAAIADRMAETLIHRGPDDRGNFVDAEAGLGFGFRRLSILDLSPTGHQPMATPDGRHVIVFNGELYNYRDIRTQLENEGVGGWRGRSDTEVMLAALTRWGAERALKAFNGMFAFALWDRRERILTLGRDRLGEKPLFYGRAGGAFLFGSELKALMAHPAWDGQVDRGALALYLRLDYVPGPYSIFRGIHKLPPGHFLTLKADQVGAGRVPAPTAYWSAAAVARAAAADPFRGDAVEAEARLDALLREAVALRLEADVPVGSFLSSGIDSSSVTAAMQAVSSQPVATFTIGFHDPKYDEAPAAAAIARHLGTRHTELYVDDANALALVGDLPRLYDEPFADFSQLPTLLLARLTRQHVTVGLSGDGGDELFGGYTRYRRLTEDWPRVAAMPAALRAGVGRLAEAVPVDALNLQLGRRLAFGGRPGRPGDRLSRRLKGWGAATPVDLYRNYVSRWRGVDRLVPGAPVLPTVFDDPSVAAMPTPAESAMLLDALGYLPDDLLVKIDRATMASGLEARAPLLDPAIAAFAWSLPLDLKLRDGGGKWLLRRVLKRYLPEALTDRPKRGFDPPLGAWLRGELRDWAEDLLEPGALAADGLIDPRPVRERWAEHLAGHRDWRHELWSVLSFAAWRRHWASSIRL